MAPPRRVAIRTDVIDLGALLKWAQVAGTGGEAKALIHDGRVRVNGRVERRRGRRVRPGDRVHVGPHALLVERSR